MFKRNDKVLIYPDPYDINFCFIGTVLYIEKCKRIHILADEQKDRENYNNGGVEGSYAVSLYPGTNTYKRKILKLYKYNNITYI